MSVSFLFSYVDFLDCILSDRIFSVSFLTLQFHFCILTYGICFVSSLMSILTSVLFSLMELARSVPLLTSIIAAVFSLTRSVLFLSWLPFSLLCSLWYNNYRFCLFFDFVCSGSVQNSLKRSALFLCRPSTFISVFSLSDRIWSVSDQRALSWRRIFFLKPKYFSLYLPG